MDSTLSKMQKKIQKKLDNGKILDKKDVEHLHSETDDVDKESEDAYKKWIKKREDK